MKGTQEYNMKLHQTSMNFIEKSNHKDLLLGFYHSMTNNTMSTRYSYIKMANTFLEAVAKDISKIGVEDINMYLGNYLFKEHSEYTSSYRIAIYSMLKKLFKYAERSHFIQENPMNYIERPKPYESQETIEKRKKNYLTQKEAKKYKDNILKGVGNHNARTKQKEWRERDQLIISIFLHTGIRCSALVKIDVNDINLENKTLIVLDKGNHIKECVLSDKIIEQVEAWLEKREQFLGDKQEDALFISNRRQRIAQRSVSEITRKYAKGISDKSISPHKLRATYGTTLYEQTRDIYFTQHSMGHSSPAVTELYVRGQNDTMKKAAEILDKAY